MKCQREYQHKCVQLSKSWQAGEQVRNHSLAFISWKQFTSAFAWNHIYVHIYDLTNSLSPKIWVGHDNAIKWNDLPRYWPFVGGIHRSWIPITRASEAELWCFFQPAPEQMLKQTIKTPVIWDAITLIMTSLQWPDDLMALWPYHLP